MSRLDPTVALLLAHQLHWIGFGGYWMCECGVRFPANDRDEAEAAHAEHVVEVVQRRLSELGVDLS